MRTILSSTLAVAASTLCALPAAANIVVVTQSGFGFSPNNITIQVGDTVRWVWTSNAHTVTEGTDGITDWDEPFFGFLNSTTTVYEHTFDAAFVAANPRANGRYDYFCEPHFPSMKGTVNLAATGTSFCAGDASSPQPCPCSNTGSSGRGCNNSTNTGGAKLVAHGDALQEAVMLTATNELASALTIFLQGDLTLATPLAFGDGLRCVGGHLKRLAVKTASLGVARFPEPGEESLAARSSALGDPVASGSTRSYQAYYRDASTSFCPAPQGDTWNATNALTLAF